MCNSQTSPDCFICLNRVSPSQKRIKWPRVGEKQASLHVVFKIMYYWAAMIRQLIHSKLLSGNKAGIFQKCQIFTGQTQDLLKKKTKKKKPELQSICFILMKGWWCYSKWVEYMLDSRRGNLLLLQETMTSYQIAQFIIISPGVQQTLTWCCCQFCANDKTVWMLEYMEAYYPPTCSWRY